MRQHALAVGVGLLFVGFGSLPAAGDAKDEAIKKDRKRYEGTWQVVSLVVDGNKAGEEDARKVTVSNAADGTWAIEAEGNVVLRGTSVIDPTKKPKAVDLTVTEGADKGKTLRVQRRHPHSLRGASGQGAAHRVRRTTGERPHPGRPQAGQEVRPASARGIPEVETVLTAPHDLVQGVPGRAFPIHRP